MTQAQPGPVRRTTGPGMPDTLMLAGACEALVRHYAGVQEVMRQQMCVFYQEESVK